jgi:hypothetical protein
LNDIKTEGSERLLLENVLSQISNIDKCIEMLMQNEEEGSSYSPVENDLSSLSSSSIDSRKSDKEIKNAQEEESKTQFIPYAKAKTGS